MQHNKCQDQNHDQFSQKMTKLQNSEQNGKKINWEAFTENQELIGHTSVAFGIDICNQRNLLASGSGDMTVKLWNLDNNSLLKTYQYSGSVLDVVFSNQGNFLAFGGGGDYLVKLIDISDLNKDSEQIDFMGHINYMCRLTFSNDSKYLISGSQDQMIIFWDVILKKESFQLKTESNVYGVAISYDDTLITSNSYDGMIRIWTIQNQKLLCTQQAHQIGAGIKFSYDKEMLVTSGQDGTIKLWSLCKLNKRKLLLIRKFKVATTCIWTVLFSSCSQFIISMSNQDKEIKVLDSQTGEVVKIFQQKATFTYYIYRVQVAISKDMDIIAYGENNNVVIWRQK